MGEITLIRTREAALRRIGWISREAGGEVVSCGVV